MITPIGDLFVKLGVAGVELAPHPTDPARLRYAPNLLPAELLDGLLQHREAILVVLRDDYVEHDADAAYVLGERLGIADDLGMATHAGSAAWLVAVGEAMRSTR